MNKLITLALTMISWAAISPSFVEAQGSFTLSQFETHFATYGKKKTRAHNIELAASHFSSITLAPGQQISFNDVVGERSKEQGFKKAPVIASGRITDDYGGGVCQVASTLFASAFLAGLGVVERHPHSRVSSYIKPGLDATVAWGKKDLILLNRFPYPVTISAFTEPTNRNFKDRIVVAISANKNYNAVAYELFHKATRKHKVVEILDRNLDIGKRVVKQKGTPRVYAVIYRKVKIGEDVVEEKYRSLYNSADEIVRVGVGKNHE